MKPSLLKRHITTKHATLENKPNDYCFVRKLTEIKNTKKNISFFSGIIYWKNCSKSIFLSELKNSEVWKTSYHRWRAIVWPANCTTYSIILYLNGRWKKNVVLLHKHVKTARFFHNHACGNAIPWNRQCAAILIK